MHIILDSNIYASDFRMESVAFRSLFDYLQKTADTLVLPRLVREEVVWHYLRELKARDQKVEKPWDQYRQVVLTEDLPRHVLREPKTQIRKLRELLRKPAPHVPTLYYPSFEHVKVDQVVLRGIKRVRPSSAKGEELRDVILWFIVLGYAEESKSDVAFVTNDSGFWDGDSVHSQITEDIKSRSVNVTLYRTIDEFLRANAPKPQVMSAEWAAAHVPVASFASELLAQAKAPVSRNLWRAALGLTTQLRSLSFVRAGFIEGTLYEVGSGVEYGEAAFSIALQAHVLVAATPAQPAGVFGMGTMQGPFLSGIAGSAFAISGPISAQQNFGSLAAIGRIGLPGSEGVQEEAISQDFDVSGTVRMSIRIAKGHEPTVQINKLAIEAINLPKPVKPAIGQT